MTFEELYYNILEESIKTGQRPEIKPEYDAHHIDCLLNPEKYPPVIMEKTCSCDDGKEKCIVECIFDAISKDEDGKIYIDKDKCTGCAACIDNCESNNIIENKDVLPTLEKINPKREISIRTEQADGVPGCRALIKKIKTGESKANFFEGMGCEGGCVGGPRRIIDTEKGRENVNKYGDKASYETPIDNPYVIELLERIGFNTIEDLLKDSEIFTRYF